MLPGSADATRRLTQAGAEVYIVSNQLGLVKGGMTLSDQEVVHLKLMSYLEGSGARVEATLVCPHLEGTCCCRKPRPGLLVDARQKDPTIVFANSIVIGDSESDLAPGRAIGAPGILIGEKAAAQAGSLNEAVARILGET